MDKISIFLIDDHKLFIDGLSSILKDKPDFEIKGFAYSANEYLKIADKIEVDIYIIDVNMPGISGVDLTKIIKAENPQAKILALSMYEDTFYVERMIQGGANGYINKSANIKELEKAIYEVARGKYYLGEGIQKAVFEKMGTLDIFEEKTDSLKSNLSQRESEILSLIGQEFSTQQIAERLYISERTVETHRKNILAKSQAKTLVGLVKYAIRQGLVYY